MRPVGRAGRSESGSATVLVLVAVGLLCFVAMALCSAVAVVKAQRTAQSAADLSALAAAQGLGVDGGGCTRAGSVAQANGSELIACVVAGREVVVQVIVRDVRFVGRSLDVRAQARAGPSASP